MRHKSIRERAILIDRFVDAYNKARKRSYFPHEEVKCIIHFLFPGSRVEGRGAFKTVHRVSSRARDLVLKTSSQKRIKGDIQVYKRIPKYQRNRYFAKIYWKTKYCLLQKYGKSTKVPEEELKKLKRIAKKYGLNDVRPANVRKVDGRFKIVDASIA